MRVFCFGEALIDMLQTDSKQEGPLSIPTFRQFPGGAPANVTVAVAKLGGDAFFIGQVGDDTFGHFLKKSLETYGVNTKHLMMHKTARTPIAFVSLDNEGERSFDFYRHDTADLAYQADQLEGTVLEKGGIFHFCSNTLTHDKNYAVTLELLDRAKKAGCLISFDFNVRANLWPDPSQIRDRILACMAYADIVKVSIEELAYVEPGGLDLFVRSALTGGVSVVLATDGGNPVQLFTGVDRREVKTPTVKAIDTTAAGDAFMGGFLCVIAHTEKIEGILTDTDALAKAVSFAVRCGAHTVTRPGAYTALPDASDITHFSLG